MVLKMQPWLFDNQLIMSEELSLDKNPKKVNPKLIPLWIQEHNLLTILIQEKNCKYPCGQTWSPQCSGFLQRPTNSDLSPLPRHHQHYHTNPTRAYVTCPNGEDCQIPFKYERFGKLCYNCGHLGHVLNKCSSDPNPPMIQVNGHHL